MTEDSLVQQLERLFESFCDDTDRSIALRRILVLDDPETLRQLGRDLDLSRERIRQRESRFKRRCKWGERTFPEDILVEVCRFTDRIGNGLIQEDAMRHLPESMSETGSLREPTIPLLFFLYLAGPYELWGDLLVQRNLKTTIKSLSEQIWATLRRDRKLTVEDADLFAHCHGITSPDIVNQVLDNLQSSHSHVYDLPGGKYVFEPKAADRAVRELNEQGHPLDIDRLAQSSNVSSGTLLNYILHDERIVRLDRNMYGLREWGSEEYDGIVSSIHKALEAMGGAGRLEDIAVWVTQRFNVSWNSVVSYANSHHDFIKSSGVVRARRPDEPLVFTDYREIGEVGDCLDIDGRPTLRVMIDSLVWRGSGHPIPRNWAMRAGLRPGRKLNLKAENGQIHLSWAGKEPTIGSLRSLALENSWPHRGVAYLILADGKLESTWKYHPSEPSTEALTIAQAMGCLFAFSEPSQGHPLGGDFWTLLGERLGLQPQYRVPGMILARLKTRREKVVEPYVEALENSLLISEARGLVVQVNA